VEDGVNAPTQVAALVGIAHVTGDDLNLGPRVDGFEPAPVVEGVVLGQGTHLAALPHEALDQMGADEPVGAGDKDLLHADHCREHPPLTRPGIAPRAPASSPAGSAPTGRPAADLHREGPRYTVIAPAWPP
jgi:hypothetical protein